MGGRWLRSPAAVSSSAMNRAILSTVSLVEGFVKVKAEQDADQDVHLKGPGSTGSTLCGMKAAGTVEGDVTCYRCHEFSRGNV
jgi:hypothetical protein